MLRASLAVSVVMVLTVAAGCGVSHYGCEWNCSTGQSDDWLSAGEKGDCSNSANSPEDACALCAQQAKAAGCVAPATSFCSCFDNWGDWGDLRF